MTKNFKRLLALLMTVMLILGVVPTTVYAAEVPPEPESAVSSEPPSEATPEPSPEPESSEAPSEAAPSSESGSEPKSELPAESDAAPSPEPEDSELTSGTELPVTQIWPAPRRKARAATIGTNGTLYMGDECCPGGVGTPPTLGEYIGTMSVITMKYDGKHVAGYCLEHEKESGDGMGYTWMDLTTGNQETIGTILALGFQWNASGPYAARSDDSDKWLVTQVLIWETVAGNAFVQANGLIGIKSGVDDDMQMISAHAHSPTKFMQYYRDLKKRLNDYFKVPSFANKEAGKAETITLRWDGSKYSATVTDTQGVLPNYNFRNAIPGVQATANGNSLTLSTTEPIMTAKTSSAVESSASTAGGKGAVSVWRTSDRNFQDFATYYAEGGDPVRCYIKVKTDAVGSAGLVKTSEDGKVEGVQFQITGSDGSSVTKTTDANGNIDIDGLPIYAADGSKITYTATEINVPNKYIKPQSQTFQLTEGQTASIRFENKLKRWRVTVTKTDDRTGSTPQGNGSLAGAKYGVYKGNELVKEYTTDENGQFTTDYYPYGEDWTLREISAGEGYLVSDVSTKLCEIPAGSNEANNDNTASVTDTVMRGGVSVEKRDSKTGERPQGDADFSGIQFEIINKSKNPVEVNGKKAAPGEVAATITTNAQGIATTGPNVLPYGDYLIREKSTNAWVRPPFA